VNGNQELLRDQDGRPVAFLLTQDTRKEVWLDATGSSGASTFAGLSSVHGRNDMRLDIQSLIDLHPFFQEEQLFNWLRCGRSGMSGSPGRGWRWWII
jgi:hypothetical protein